MPASALDQTLQALADPTRRRVVELLRGGPRCAGELADAVGVSAPAMSRHLKVLRTRGLIEDERSPEDARMRVYALRRERFDTLQGWLDEVQAFWTEQLDAFKAHAEGARDRGPSGRGRGPGRPRRRNPRKRT